MSTIQMNCNSGVTANLTLPAPSGALVAVTGGIGSVNVADVPAALAAGWTILAGQNYSASAVKHLTAPATGNWPLNGSVVMPDGAVLTTTNGAALVPIQWVNYLKAYGWYPTPNTSWGE